MKKILKWLVSRVDNKTEFENLINQLKTKYINLWWNINCDFPKLDKIDRCRKITNERYVTKFKKEIVNTLKQASDDREEIDDFEDKILRLIKELESNVIGYKISNIDYFMDKGYLDITEEFIKEVKKFDSNMDIDDIFQAIRNVWIMNSLQILFDMDVKLTPSIFSYSMLYPYSDNYIDDTEIKLENKITFNNKFRKLLCGEKVEPSNHNEKAISQLVNKIENEFSRKNYPNVYNSLLSIHEAQEKSLFQQKGESFPYERDLLGITFEKGGTSVLADGYLVKGNLSSDEADFMFGYGVFLQLIDDLQDVLTDLKNEHTTIFSQIANKYTLDKITNKLFNFTYEILNNSNIYASEEALRLKNIIYESCNVMIIEAISKNKKLFTKNYLKRIEEYSMFRLSYYKKIEKSVKKEISSKDINKLIYSLNV